MISFNTTIKTNFRFIHNNKAKELIKNIKRIEGIEVKRIPQPEDKLNFTQIICHYHIHNAKRIREQLSLLTKGV